MKKVVIVIVGAVLFATSAMADPDHVCLDSIPQSTPTVDFTDHGDGTATHLRTGLMWKRCLEGVSGTDCASGSASSHTLQAALQLAEAHSFAGHADWRLPNIKELGSIIEQSCDFPRINLDVLPNQQISWVWSGSPVYFGQNQEFAWGVRFGYGNGGGVRSQPSAVRLVRDGQ